jgi:hypothetical protein
MIWAAALERAASQKMAVARKTRIDFGRSRGPNNFITSPKSLKKLTLVSEARLR